jgi:transposase
VTRQRIGRAHPDRFELLGLIGHGLLAFRHASNQKRHVEAARQVAVGDPVREHKDLCTGQRETLCRTLGGKRVK